MAVSIARTFFSSLLTKLEKKRQAVQESPLSMRDINALLSMRCNNKPLFELEELFYTEEYKSAQAAHTDPAELEKIVKYRPATAEEANILYSDIHTRDEKERYAASQNNSSN